MKDLLLRQVQVVDPGGPHHDAQVDVLVRNGRFERIGQRVPKGEATEVHAKGLHVSPGWVDLCAHFRDPGDEQKEDLVSGSDAAAAGGFTAVAVLPSTHPPVDSRAGIEYMLRRTQAHAVRVLPLGALTRGMKGEQLAETFDMQQAGALAFTDDRSPIRNTRLMMLALQYTKGFGGTVVAFPNDPDLAAGGQMHEGNMNVRLGLKGIPAEAEVITLLRDLELLAYTGGRLHVALLSTARSVELVRQAKQAKLDVTASVAAHHLLLDDGCLRGFDTNYKVAPPLRDPVHIDALREGVKDGTIDAVVSDHRPEDVEHKVLEFGAAAFGAIGLETSYSAANTAMQGRMSTRRIVERFCQGPRKVLGLPVPHLEEGAEAEITLFDPAMDHVFAPSDLRSRARNTPFIGQRFVGRPLGIVARGKAVLSSALASAAVR